MKRFLLILAGLAALAVLALVVFLATFDADRYRPLLTQRLEEALGHPVKLGRVSLGWRRGVAARLDGLTIYADAQRSRSVAEMQSAHAVVRLMPLLSRRVEVASVELQQPVLRLERDAQGQLKLAGAAPLVGPVAASGASTDVGGAPVTFAIESVRIVDGDLTWHDAATQPPTYIHAQDLELTLRHLVPGEPMGVEAAGRLQAQLPDIAFEGLVAGQGRVTLPAAGQAPGDLAWSISSATVKDGSLQWTRRGTVPPIQTVVKALELTVKDAAPGAPVVCEARGALGGDVRNVEFSGRVTPPGPGQPGAAQDVRLSLDRIPLDQLLPPSAPGQAALRGILTAKLEAESATLDPQQILRAASGRGTLRLEQPVLENVNVLREVFSQLSMLPGLVERLQARLPAEYQEKLNARDTVLEPIEVSPVLQAGMLQMEAVRLSTESFRVTAGGQVGLDRSVNMRGVLAMDPVLSDAFIRSVEELRGLVNQAGEMEIPISRIQSVPPYVLPDLGYIAKRVLINKAVDLLGELLRGKEPDAPEAQTASPEAGDRTAPPAESGGSESDLLGNILQRVLERRR